METKPFSDLSEGLRAEIKAYIEKHQPVALIEQQVCEPNVDESVRQEHEVITTVYTEFENQINKELTGLATIVDEKHQFYWFEDFEDFCREHFNGTFWVD